MNSTKAKNLYQLNKARKTAYFNTMDYKHLEQPFLQLLMNNEKQFDDSLDQLLTVPLSSKQSIETKTKQQEKQEPKLNLHSRSQSCPYITPNFQQNIFNQQSQGSQPVKQRQPRYSLNRDMNSPQGKKIRKLNNMILPFAKRKQPRNSMMSQSSQSVVIHNNLANSLNIESSCPISSMLYSQKKNSTQVKKPIQKVSRKSYQSANEDSWRKTKYLKIKLQQQIKKYQLNNDLKKLQKQSNDINIKQVVFENMLRKSESQNKYLSCETNQSFILEESL